MERTSRKRTNWLLLESADAFGFVSYWLGSPRQASWHNCFVSPRLGCCLLVFWIQSPRRNSPEVGYWESPFSVLLAKHTRACRPGWCASGGQGQGPGEGHFLFFHFILILFLCSAKHSSIPAAETTLKHPDPMVSYGKGQEMGIKMNRSTLHLSTCTNGPHIISHLILMTAPHCPDIERGT